MAKQPFALIYAPVFKDHMRPINRKYHSLIHGKIVELLSHAPDEVATNRKPLREPILGATWEIRLGPNNRFRVFYDVDLENHLVYVAAIGEKERNQLLIGGEEFP